MGKMWYYVSYQTKTPQGIVTGDAYLALNERLGAEDMEKAAREIGDVPVILSLIPLPAQTRRPEF